MGQARHELLQCCLGLQAPAVQLWAFHVLQGSEGQRGAAASLCSWDLWPPLPLTLPSLRGLTSCKEAWQSSRAM